MPGFGSDQRVRTYNVLGASIGSHSRTHLISVNHHELPLCATLGYTRHEALHVSRSGDLLLLDGNSHSPIFHSLSSPSTSPYSFQDPRTSHFITTPRNVLLLTCKGVSFSSSLPLPLPAPSLFRISSLSISSQRTFPNTNPTVRPLPFHIAYKASALLI